MKKSLDEILENKESKLSKGPLLRYTIKPNDIAEIIYRLFVSKHYTAKDKTYNVVTNKINGDFSTRSIEDFYRVCKYYIHDIKYKTVYEIVTKLEKQDKIFGDYCITCRRRVYHLSYELGNLKSDGKSKEIIGNILGELNIKIK